MFSRQRDRNAWKRTLVASSMAVALCLSSVLSAQTEKKKIPTGATRLAQYMQLRESTRLGAEISLQKAVEQGRITQQEFDCTKASSLDFALDAYSAAIAAALSPSEIKQANAFFSSPAGHSYLRYSRSLELHQRGIPDVDPKLGLDKAESAATNKFIATSAGKKLIQDRVIETPELKTELARGFAALKTQCSA